MAYIKENNENKLANKFYLNFLVWVFWVEKQFEEIKYLNKMWLFRRGYFYSKYDELFELNDKNKLEKEGNLMIKRQIWIWKNLKEKNFKKKNWEKEWKDIVVENGIVKVKKEEEEEFEEFLNEEKKKVLKHEINWETEEGNLEERKEFYKVSIKALSNKEERNNLIELINYTKIMELIKNLKNKIKEKRENKLIIEEEEENIFLKEIKEELEKYEKEEKLKEEIEKMKETEIEEIEKDEKKIVKEVEEEDPTINERKEKLSNLLNTIIDGTSNENADNIEEILELLKENFINKWVKENNKKKIYLISTNTKQFFDKNEEIIETIILTMDSDKKGFFGNIPKCIFKFSEELCRNDNSLFCLFCKVNVIFKLKLFYNPQYLPFCYIYKINMALIFGK
uniref:Uncharacterized protein n=1 Tax=Meloidogyne enterolobii TaxID=390850 RepID=A0A6V7VX67_MELEN|nr:unnamed protein product [Meloidogyne enterolobii]